MSGIEIHGKSTSKFLTVSLGDILTYFYNIPNTVKWCLFSLEAWADTDKDSTSLVNLERAVDNSANGILVDTEKIKLIASDAFQVINLILIGGSDDSSLYIDDSYRNARSKYQYYIELLDSSFFIVYSHDESFLNCLQSNLDGIKILE